jgi:hypothetical protein
LMGKSHGLLAEYTHEILPELARRANYRGFQIVPSFAIVSFSRKGLN